MTRDEVINLAVKAGFMQPNGSGDLGVRHHNGSWVSVQNEVMRFHAYVRVEERRKPVTPKEVPALIEQTIKLKTYFENCNFANWLEEMANEAEVNNEPHAAARCRAKAAAIREKYK